MANLSHTNIQALADKLAAFFNVKLRKPVVLSNGHREPVVDEKKIFLDEQFKIIMKKIKEVHS